MNSRRFLGLRMNNEQHMNVDVPWKAFEEHLLFLRVCGLILAPCCLLITLPVTVITVNFATRRLCKKTKMH